MTQQYLNAVDHTTVDMIDDYIFQASPYLITS